jgi:hypothetical protein
MRDEGSSGDCFCFLECGDVFLIWDVVFAVLAHGEYRVVVPAESEILKRNKRLWLLHHVICKHN